jgi:sulfhydrogenase subunit delta
MEKMKCGFFKFTGCAGCQMEILRAEDTLPQLLELIEINYWPMVTTKDWEEDLDVAFVEGSVSTPREIREIKEIRERSKFLVALGDCAVAGCIPSIRNFMTQREAEKAVYPNPAWVESIGLRGISEYVDVDISLPGCPPHRNTILEAVKGAALKRRPYLRHHSVCVECKLKDNGCLLTEEKRPCMGPVTNAGCGAICPTLNRVCEGCYGPMSAPNAESMAQILVEAGLTEDDVRRKFRKYAGWTPEYRREAM